jgi:hypothetical protein
MDPNFECVPLNEGGNMVWHLKLSAVRHGDAERAERRLVEPFPQLQCGYHGISLFFWPGLFNVSLL